MKESGTLVLCGDADAESRVVSAASIAGLGIAVRWIVVPREGERPLFAVWALRSGDSEPKQIGLTLRDSKGNQTQDAKRLRSFSGID